MDLFGRALPLKLLLFNNFFLHPEHTQLQQVFFTFVWSWLAAVAVAGAGVVLLLEMVQLVETLLLELLYLSQMEEQQPLHLVRLREPGERLLLEVVRQELL
jgi:hypothetical protein